MASASSSFTGTENPLSEGGAWAALTAYWQHLTKANGAKVDGTVLSNDCAARYVGTTFSADHGSQITLAALPSGAQMFFQYVMCRMNSTAGCYLLTTAPDIDSTLKTLQLYKVNDSGAYTQIGANITLGAAMVANDVLRLEVVGTSLNCKLNSTLVRNATDSTFATGQPGLGGWAQNSGSNVVLVSAWSADDITASAGAAPFRPRNPSYQFSI